MSQLRKKLWARSLILGALPLVPLVAGPATSPVRAQNTETVHSAPQVRLEGRVKALSPDLRGFDLEMVMSTSPSGLRKLLPAPVLRKVRLADVCYISPRDDRERFFTPGDIPVGGVVVVLGAQGAGEEFIAGQVLIGGVLPELKAAAPVSSKPTPNPDAISLPPLRKGLAKYEPKYGCYLGAFVMRDENIGTSMARWERTVGKGHASYLRYVGYGQPFPTEWVREVRRLGAAPNLAWEPNAGLNRVQEDSYMRNFARAAARSGGPVFLRFASEMNGTWTAYSGNPTLYRAKFRMVARVMRQEAPNVALVWTPYCMPSGNIPTYYPGDAAVDWVGINIYSVHHHNGRIEEPASHEDPTQFLKSVYDRYASRKPIQVSEYAATNYCLACEQSIPQFAINKMQRMYGSLRRRFPRVKMIYWFSWDTISGGAAENNYAVTGDPEILGAYRAITHSPYFLARIPASLASRPWTREVSRTGGASASSAQQ